MEGEIAPRERKIRRGIVTLSSFQVALGGVIIGMSFTAFASTSSAKIRGASPYWAGFMVSFSLSIVCLLLVVFLRNRSFKCLINCAMVCKEALGGCDVSF